MDLTIDQAIKKLKAGEVIGVPTDTVYGLSCLLPYSEELYRIKHREKSKKLITMISSISKLDINDEILLAKMKEVWPGRVTLIFEYNGEMTSFRIPDEPNLLELLEKLDEPIYTTSANISGMEPCANRQHFAREFPNQGLLAEEINSEKSSVPSQIYVYENCKFERIR